MAEWSKAIVSKTIECIALTGSNPVPAAIRLALSEVEWARSWSLTTLDSGSTTLTIAHGL